MKKNWNVVSNVLLSLFAVINITLYALGYIYKPYSVWVYGLFIVAYIVLTAFSIAFKSSATLLSRVFAFLTPVTSFIYFISLYILISISGIWFGYMLLVLTGIVMCSFIYVAYTKCKTTKIASIAVGTVLVVLMLVPTYVALWFDNFPFSKTVVENISVSPSGSLMAAVETYDEGALGGSTVVVVKTAGEDRLYGFERRAVRLMRGQFGEKYDIRWEDDNIVVINEMEYDLSDYFK